MRQRPRRLAGFVASAWAAAIVCGCMSDHAAPAARPADVSALSPLAFGRLRPVPLPDLSHMAGSVRDQIQSEYSLLTSAIENPSTTTAALSQAYGRMANLLMATQYRDLAESCYLNAQALAPAERRWPYYLGHLYRIKGEFAKSVAFFEQALELLPDDVPTLVWLAEVHLAESRPEAAEPLLDRVLALQPDSVAGRFGLGRAALARQDYSRAVQHFEKALALDERATSVHYPLAMAYRGLGELAKAEAHLRQRGDLQILPADPLIAEADVLLRTPQAYERRGTQALDSGDWQAAAVFFRQGIELAPANPALRHGLGIALFNMGEVGGAEEQLEEALRLAPAYSKAHYSLALLLEASGRDNEAIDRFAAVVRSDPRYLEPHLRVAALLRRTGRFDEALSHYEQVITTDPRVAEATFGYATTLVSLRRYQEARDRLVELVKAYPDQPMFAHALARLLAAAPDARVRDGLRAMAVLDALPERQRIIDWGETLAMALAELEDYEDAARWQREAMAVARRAGREDVVPRMAEKLSRYERGRPWRHDNPIEFVLPAPPRPF